MTRRWWRGPLPPPWRAGSLAAMCTAVTCAACGRPSYVGCGDHVEQVLGDVPATERCTCAGDGRPSAVPVLPGHLFA